MRKGNHWALDLDPVGQPSHRAETGLVLSATLWLSLATVSYPTTNNRLQITTVDGKNPALRLHEDAGDGSPICKIALRPYQGQAVQFTSRGPGEVTCAKCARVNL